MSRIHPYFVVVTQLAIAMSIIVMAPACSKEVDVAPTPANPDDVMAAWRTLMEAPAQNIDNPELTRLAAIIGQKAPHYIDEMIGGFEDPAISGEALFALVTSLEQIVSPEMVPKLVTFTTSDQSGTVRRAATHLLGEINSDSAKDALLILKDDESETVRLTALLGLAQQGNQAVREDLREIFRRDDVMDSTRERIVLTTCDVPIEGDRAILEEGIQIEGLQQGTYVRAVSVLGRIGTLESIDPLNALKARPDSSVAVRDMCENTIAAIEERETPA